MKFLENPLNMLMACGTVIFMTALILANREENKDAEQ